MKEYVVPFISLLAEYIEIYKQLVTLAQEKTQVLVAGDIKKLDRLLAQETELLLLAGKLENQRKQTVEVWAKAAQWPNVDITIEYIIMQLPAPEQEAVRSKSVELKHVIDELRNINATNGELIEKALQFVNYSLELMTGGDAGGMTYGANGHLGGRQGYKVFDHKA